MFRGVDHLLFLFHFEFFDELEGCLLIISHVSIPGLLEFSELGLLSALNVHKFLLLGKSHVLLLPLLFCSRKLIKLLLHDFGARVVFSLFSLEAEHVKDPKNIDFRHIQHLL